MFTSHAPFPRVPMERDAFHSWGATDGDNPLYRSVNESFSCAPIEYDEIKQDHPEPVIGQDHYDEPSKFHGSMPTDYKTTPNTLYGSKGNTLVHPAVTMDRLMPVPEEQKQQNKSKKGRVWKCSIDMFITITSILVILISGMCLHALIILRGTCIVSYTQSRTYTQWPILSLGPIYPVCDLYPVCECDLYSV